MWVPLERRSYKVDDRATTKLLCISRSQFWTLLYGFSLEQLCIYYQFDSALCHGAFDLRQVFDEVVCGV